MRKLFYKFYFCFVSLVIIISFSKKYVLALPATGKINSDNAVLQSAPIHDALILDRFAEGKYIKITKQTNDFYKVDVDGIGAYISSNYIDIVETKAVVNDDNVNIRTLPYIDAQIVKQVFIGDELNICAKLSDWFVVNYNGNKVYIAREFIDCDCNDICKLKEITAPLRRSIIVKHCDGLNLRKSDNIESDVICIIPQDSVLDVLEESINGEWIKVMFEKNFGYIYKDYTDVYEGIVAIEDTKEKIKKEEVRSKSSIAQEIIEYAKQFIGVPYVYGGTNLKHGVDCSGFVYSVMRNFTINLNRSSLGQSHDGIYVNKNELLPGDLVFFSNNGQKNIQHVGIYIGNEEFIHSASPNKKGVMISKLTSRYYKINYITARRVISI
jgi:cell wall-associated NlpC family hydrolase